MSIGKPPVPVNAPEKPSWGVRLRSWKWWVYGAVNSQPREKPPKGYYFQIAMAVALWAVIAGHPWLTTWINRHPPELSSLEMVKGTVVRTARKSPHLGLRLENGEIRDIEFPVFLNTYGGVARTFRHLPGNYNGDFMDCEATVWFDMPKYTLWKRYRIWQVICANSPVRVNYEQIVAEDRMFFVFTGVVAFVALPFLLLIYFIRYRRGYYER